MLTSRQPLHRVRVPSLDESMSSDDSDDDAVEDEYEEFKGDDSESTSSDDRDDASDEDVGPALEEALIGAAVRP